MKTTVTVLIECTPQELVVLSAFAAAAHRTSSDATVTIRCQDREITVECVGVEGWTYYRDQWVKKYGKASVG